MMEGSRERIGVTTLNRMGRGMGLETIYSLKDGRMIVVRGFRPRDVWPWLVEYYDLQFRPGIQTQRFTTRKNETR